MQAGTGVWQSPTQEEVKAMQKSLFMVSLIESCSFNSRQVFKKDLTKGLKPDIDLK